MAPRLPTTILTVTKVTSRPRHLSTTTRLLRRRGDYIPADLGATHKPSLGGSSMGHLISELGATRAGMEGLRKEGETMSEEQRTFARKVAKWVLGVPLLFGTTVVGGRYFFGVSEEERLKGAVGG